MLFVFQNLCSPKVRIGFEKCDFSGPNRKKYIEYSAGFVIGVLAQPRLPEDNPTAGVKKQGRLITQK